MASDLDEMVTWIREQIDHTERVANEARHDGTGRWHQTDPDREHGRIEDERGWVVVYDEGRPSGWEAEHIALHDPAHALTVVAAHRAILDLWDDVMRNEDHHAGWVANEAVRLVATAYSTRDGFRQEWLS